MSEKATDRLASTGPRLGGATRLVLAAALLPGIVMPLVGCGSRASTSPDSASVPPDASPPASIPARSGEHPPIPPAALRELAEGQETWSRPRKARCPRQLPDRHEDLRRYPAISLLDGLGYITIADGIGPGIYVKNMEFTATGRGALGSDLEESADWYVITIARREYLPGTEEFEIRPEGDRLVAFFRWRWKPLNALGERLPLGPSQSQNDYFNGFATYTRDASGWTLDKVFLNGDDSDF